MQALESWDVSIDMAPTFDLHNVSIRQKHKVRVMTYLRVTQFRVGRVLIVLPQRISLTRDTI